MLVRRNHFYQPVFKRDRMGLLLVTKRWIIATRQYALCWA